MAEVDCVFDAPMVTVEDEREQYGELRLRSLGWFRDRVVFLVWTERDGSARVISCRYGDKHETRAYFKALDLWQRADCCRDRGRAREGEGLGMPIRSQ
ncbi:BrnT family toxin [Accumulibacter sp.]|uniref:BrnT family toxin n=1 Tax=Accumulibacter sp. TaxID=2053492 RepID=UPI0025F5D9DC|nr:BrnT family toxin [Accumulibacter sp.]MCM8613685.1 BrnT family toxin [Accumulibacter sp.]MCM8637970.1 BrnT family toxin [Accumulibacter sp.]MCM8641239.1 BrnT family toxin [Accumulibacter sp.]